jgi:hypothetical protein
LSEKTIGQPDLSTGLFRGQGSDKSGPTWILRGIRRTKMEYFTHFLSGGFPGASLGHRQSQPDARGAEELVPLAQGLEDFPTGLIQRFVQIEAVGHGATRPKRRRKTQTSQKGQGFESNATMNRVHGWFQLSWE